MYYMGRKKLNRSKEEIRDQWKIRSNRYYQKHKEDIKKRNLRKYYENIGNIQSNQ